MATIPLGSREYLTVPVRVLNEVSQAPTAVEIAIVGLADTPAEAAWKAASWLPEGAARLLVDFTMPKGRYAVWVRVTDNPERIVRRSGEIEVI